MSSSQTSPTSATAGNPLGMPNVAFIGKAGAGKSTAAKLLLNAHPSGRTGYVLLSFAAPLKKIAVDLWGTGADTDRNKLQRLGVAVREIEEDTWANRWARSVEECGGPVVTDDLRFPNEYYTAKSLGFVTVRIRAPKELRVARLTALGKLQDEAQLEHESETALDLIPADYDISGTGSEVDLADQLFPIIEREAARR